MRRGASPRFRGRRWLLVLALLGLMGLVMLRLTDLRTLAAILARGNWWWVLAATAVHVLYFVLYALLYRYSFAAAEVDSRLAELIPLLFASIFVNTVTVSAGAGAAALFIDDAVERGESGARASVAVVLVLTVDLLTLVPFLLSGMEAISTHRTLRIPGAVAGGIFLLYTTFLCVALVLAGWRPRLLHWVLTRCEAGINRIGAHFRRPALLPDGWGERTAWQAAEASLAIFSHPRRLLLALLTGLVLHVVNLAGLYLLFLAFQQPVDLGTLLAGFGLGVISLVITLVPQGVGAAEGIMALVFTALGIPGPQAVAISLAFRGLNFWLPLLLGFFCLRSTRFFGKGGPSASPSPESRAPVGCRGPFEDASARRRQEECVGGPRACA